MRKNDDWGRLSGGNGLWWENDDYGRSWGEVMSCRRMVSSGRMMAEGVGGVRVCDEWENDYMEWVG